MNRRTKILILGHNGMLGNAVSQYFSSQNDYEVETTNTRWNKDDFIEYLSNSDADVIINCIGAIPQKKLSAEAYTSINVELPIHLETLGKKIIHPTTDCEFSGTIPETEKYSKTSARDAEDDYGMSKAQISRRIEEDFSNTKMIRT